jgi:hypothetical protein
MLLIAMRLSVAQSSPCDPNLPQSPLNPYGYRLRTDRCEGVYIQEVSGAPLQIVSWTRSFPNYDSSLKQPVSINWDTVPGGEVMRLRAQALRRHLYYRMDAVRAPANNSFAWPLDLLFALGISRPEIGVVGLTRAVVEGSERDIYLPLRISQGEKSQPALSYQLVLLPGVEIKELFLTLTPISKNKSAPLKDGEPVAYGYYPAEQPIELPIASVQRRGFYHLEIAARLKNGGASAIDLWFFHPGS